MINAETARNIAANSKDVEDVRVTKFMRRYYRKILKKALQMIEQRIVNVTNQGRYDCSYTIMKCGIIDPFFIRDLLDRKLKKNSTGSLQIEIECAIANALLKDVPLHLKANGFDVYTIIKDDSTMSITSITRDDRYVFARIDIKWGSDENSERKK